jgi:glutamate synthase domain-containing protein 3
MGDTEDRLIFVDSLGTDADIQKLHEMIQKHFRYTGSVKAKEMLDNWELTKNLFVKVIHIKIPRRTRINKPRRSTIKKNLRTTSTSGIKKGHV